ncbi:chemotaxis protein CheC [Clostridium sp. HCP1S3_B4]|uniref:chemotaxis protein CheC n=1 Tax=unclassified Clostridium TaxID=2614128 RepID=UPI002A7B7F0A|nr:chemotaxis protein CheC [Clostridiales bacterium]MDY2729493.1 chemotaxis protein CheC [Clostridium sp.]
MKDKFTNIQLDALKEVSNIGAGNGATSLSMMLGKKIDMTVPAVNIVKMDDLINSAGEKEVIGILVKVLGDIKGSILIEFEKDKAMQIANKLIGNNDMTELNSMSTSALCEIGNIVSASYMNSIAKFTGLEISPSVPELADDMSSSILSIVFVESGQYDDYILDIETIFLDENNNNLGAHFYYVPEPGSLEKILKTIGIN